MARARKGRHPRKRSVDMDPGATRAFAAVEDRTRVPGGRRRAIARGDRRGARGLSVRKTQELGRTLPGLSLDAGMECAFSRLACRCKLLESTFAAGWSQDPRTAGRKWTRVICI